MEEQSRQASVPYLQVTVPAIFTAFNAIPFYPQIDLKMSDLKATVKETTSSVGHVGFHVEGYERIEYDFTIMDGVFDVKNPELAKCYKKWNRCLAVTDLNIYNVYGKQMDRYFKHHGLELVFHKTKIGEKAKTMPTLLSIVDSMNEFGIYRKVCTLAIAV